jgi:ATP-binding cassette subfamily D (ALD) long-chain fatty acid import protein
MLNILRWLLVAIPATWTNSWLSYVQNKLAIAYRSRLTDEILREYLGDDEHASDKVYYKLGSSSCLFSVFSTELASHSQLG